MVNQEILAGIQHAISKGETLQHAMQTFYNAGYKKEEIYDAARNIQAMQNPLVQQTQQPAQAQYQKIQRPAQQVSAYESQQKTQQKPKVIQKVSAYEKKQSKGYGAIIFLIIILFALIGALVSVFLFKDQILNLFN